jgi:glutamate synthase domain-containing protein 3
METVQTAIEIDATDLHYRELNARLRQAVANGVERIDLHNVCGQRYLGTDLHRPVEIHIYGTPGNDLASFMDGPRIVVHGNAQDGCGNTMNGGELIVHGRAGDVTGHSMRGGKIFIRGVLVVLGLTLGPGERHIANFIGTGMHGGVMYIRGELEDYQLGKEVGQVSLDEDDQQLLKDLVTEFAGHFGRDARAILSRPFTKLIPLSLRPYGRLYAY